MGLVGSRNVKGWQLAKSGPAEPEDPFVSSHSKAVGSLTNRAEYSGPQQLDAKPTLSRFILKLPTTFLLWYAVC